MGYFSQRELEILEWIARQLDEPVAVINREYESQRRKPNSMDVIQYMQSKTKK